MAKPSKMDSIDRKQFENLCALQCTMLEICEFFDITDKTLTAWCKKVYKLPFSEVFKRKRTRGFISLRRTQFKLAESNPSLAIFLGKNYLNQSDKIITENTTQISTIEKISKQLLDEQQEEQTKE